MIGLPFLEPDEITPCMEAYPEDYFPNTGGQSPKGVRALCEGCWVQPDCAEYAIRHHYLDGVWGGMGPGERKEAWRRRGLPDLTPRIDSFIPFAVRQRRGPQEGAA